MPEDISSKDSLEITLRLPLVELPQTYGCLLERIRAEDKKAFESRKKDKDPESRIACNRIVREIEEIHAEDSVPYLSIAPIDGVLDNCLTCMEAPKGSPYEGGVFWLHVAYPKDYPWKPPVVRFVTTIYHPNVDMDDGTIGLDILTDKWSIIMRTETLLVSILSIFGSPLLEDPVMPDIANSYEHEYQEYLDIAQCLTKELANGERPDTSSLLNGSDPSLSASKESEPLLCLDKLSLEDPPQKPLSTHNNDRPYTSTASPAAPLIKFATTSG
jgi:ubiquitin-protein ligase